ncbi:MAG TPA: tRNA (adenosine(37)-N6)-threonylcarbamoyltransferase complex dimerization subunit type 1 TsaB [Burkholderiaceae bacterium]|nr:tRNA (adenosine(37)-N6)-threonylcarbamoyltransferase complex dimerization subunit type 1 TsaB [Burkholderiaceae bacterium]
MPASPDPRDAARGCILAIDTTAGICSVALDGPAGTARRAEPMTQGHSRHVLAMVRSVLDELDVAPDAVDAIGFGAGPGSFTGLRIACGIAQGLGFGWSRPLVPVDSMRTLALQGALADGGSPAGALVLVALDLRMGEVCRAAFRADALAADGWPEPLAPTALGGPDEALAAFEALAAGGAGRSASSSLRLAGDGFDAAPALAGWAAARAVDATRPASAVQPDAAAVAVLARRGLAAGRAIDAADAAPVYLRDKVALDVGEQAALRAARAAAAR